MGVKGMSGILATVFVLLVVVLVIVSTNVIFSGEKGLTKNANIQATIYTMKNSMEAADLYTKVSMDYSVYQACYDMLRWGGFEESNKNWSNSQDKSESPPTNDKFKQRLQELTQRYMNRYTRYAYYFMDDYNVTSQYSSSLPEVIFTGFVVDYLDLTISAKGEKEMYIRKTIDEYKEEIIIINRFHEDKHYDIPCLGLFTWGKSNHEDIKTAANQEIATELEKWPTRNDRERSYTGSCDGRNVADRLFYEVAEDLIKEPEFDIPYGITMAGEEWENAIELAEKKMQESLENSIFSAVFGLNNFNLYTYVMSPEIEVDVNILPNCQEEERDGECYYS